MTRTTRRGEGSIPSRGAFCVVAQLVEPWTVNPLVAGSSPARTALGVWQNQKLHPAFNRNYVGAIPTAPTLCRGSLEFSNN